MNRHCEQCGFPAEHGRFCSNCGHQLATGGPRAGQPQAGQPQPGQSRAGQQETLGSLLRDVDLGRVTRDVVAAVVLFGSLGLRWDQAGRGIDNAPVILSVLVAAMALLLPYLGATGVLPKTWTSANTRLTRLILGVPYLTVTVIVVLRDLIDSQGVGLSLAVGLAGVLMAVMPRAAETGPPEQAARVAYQWRMAALALSLSVPVLAVLGFAMWQARLGRTASEEEIAMLLPTLWLPIVFGWVAWQLVTGHAAGRPVAAMVGLSVLVAALAHRADQGDVPFTVASPAACVLAVFAATAAITSEVTRRDVEPSPSGRPRWFTAAGYGLLAIAVGYGVLVVAGAVRLGAVPAGRGTQTINLVLCLIGLCSAIMCRAVLSASPHRARSVALGTLAALAFVWVVAYSVFTSLGELSNPTASTVAFTLPAAVVLALLLPPSVRGYLNEAVPAAQAASAAQAGPGGPGGPAAPAGAAARDEPAV